MQGGTVGLPGVAQLSVPMGAFSQSTTIQIAQIPKSSVDADLALSAGMFVASGYLNSAVRVTLQNQQPSVPVGVTLTVPASFISSKPAGSAIRVLVATENASDSEGPYAYFELVSPTVNQSNSTLSFQAEPSYFAQTQGGNQTGTFVVALAPGP